MVDLAEYVDGLPNISGSEERIRQAIQASRTDAGVPATGDLRFR